MKAFVRLASLGALALAVTSVTPSAVAQDLKGKYMKTPTGYLMVLRRGDNVLQSLEQLAQVNAREFTEKLFASGSLLTLKSAPQAITTDCKEYREDGIWLVADLVPEMRGKLEAFAHEG